VKRLAILLGLMVFLVPQSAFAKKRPGPAATGKSSAGKAQGTAATDDSADDTGQIKRGERIEFDERLIQGQTAKAGALYLFDRKPSDLRSMVHERESYRTEMVEQVFPQESKP